MEDHSFQIERYSRLDGLLPDARYTRLLGWRAGLIKEMFLSGIEPGEPKLFHVTVIHAAVERLVGTPHKANLRAAGSGISLARAFGGAVGEVAERYSCFFYDPEKLVLASYDDLCRQSIRAVGPDRLQFFSEEQFARRDFPYRRFHPGTRIAWTPGVSLVTGETVMVPAQFVYFGFRLQRGEELITYPTSSGCACAQSMPEALLKGIAEQVERDAVMITWVRGIKAPGFSIESDASLVEFCRKQDYVVPGRNFHLRYISLDVEIPAFLGLVEILVGGRKRIFIGGAAHINPRLAALKALLELAQGVPFIKYILVNDPHPQYAGMDFNNFDDNLRYYADPENQSALDFLMANRKSLSIAQLPNHSTGAIEQDLARSVRLLSDKGLEPIALDHTTEDLRESELYVGRVLIPEFAQLGVPGFPFLGSRRLVSPPSSPWGPSQFAFDGFNRFIHPYP